jgi:hypothetical protein
MLADTIGERNIWRYTNLEAAADYIEKVSQYITLKQN